MVAEQTERQSGLGLTQREGTGPAFNLNNSAMNVNEHSQFRHTLFGVSAAIFYNPRRDIA
jgi:hypothetical protein